MTALDLHPRSRVGSHRLDWRGKKLVQPGELIHLTFTSQSLFRIESWVVEEGEKLAVMKVRFNRTVVKDLQPSRMRPWPTLKPGDAIVVDLHNPTSELLGFRSVLVGLEVT